MVIANATVNAQRFIFQRILTKHGSQVAAGFIIGNRGVDLLAIGFHASGDRMTNVAGIKALLGRPKDPITPGFKPVRFVHALAEVTAIVDTGAEFQC